MTSLHGRQYTSTHARAHWILRAIERVTPSVGDRLVLYVALFAIGFIAGMLLFSR